MRIWKTVLGFTLGLLLAHGARAAAKCGLGPTLSQQLQLLSTAGADSHWWGEDASVGVLDEGDRFSVYILYARENKLFMAEPVLEEP